MHRGRSWPHPMCRGTYFLGLLAEMGDGLRKNLNQSVPEGLESDYVLEYTAPLGGFRMGTQDRLEGGAVLFANATRLSASSHLAEATGSISFLVCCGMAPLEQRGIWSAILVGGKCGFIFLCLVLHISFLLTQGLLPSTVIDRSDPWSQSLLNQKLTWNR